MSSPFYLGLSGPSSLFSGTTISLDAFKSKISQSCNCSTIKLPQRQFPWGPLTPLKYILSSSIYLYSVGMQYSQKQLSLMLSKSRISIIFLRHHKMATKTVPYGPSDPLEYILQLNVYFYDACAQYF